MKRHHEHDLLTQLFSGENLEDLRQATLQSGLADLRHRRRIRRVVNATALACLMLVFASAILLLEGFPHRRNNDLAKNPSLSPRPLPGQKHTVKIITDEELFALFPNRPMALVGNPGHQQLVFLDQSGVAQ